jgi:hypothetical protein
LCTEMLSSQLRYFMSSHVTSIYCSVSIVSTIQATAVSCRLVSVNGRP